MMCPKCKTPKSTVAHSVPMRCGSHKRSRRCKNPACKHHFITMEIDATGFPHAFWVPRIIEWMHKKKKELADS